MFLEYHHQHLQLQNNFSELMHLILSLNIDIEFHKTHEKEFNPSVAWHKCKDDNINQYQNKLDSLLLQINPNHEEWKCRDYKCKKHTAFVKEIHSKIVKICKEALDGTLPHISQNKDVKIIPGLNEHFKEHADRANMWHNI